MATQNTRIQRQPLLQEIIPANEAYETVLLLLRKRACAQYTIYYPHAAPLSVKTWNYMAMQITLLALLWEGSAKKPYRNFSCSGRFQHDLWVQCPPRVTAFTEVCGHATSGGHPFSLSRPRCSEALGLPALTDSGATGQARGLAEWKHTLSSMGCLASSSDDFLLSQSDKCAVSQNLLWWLLSCRSQQKQGERKLTKGSLSLQAVSVSGRLAMQTNEGFLELARDFWQTRVFVTATFTGDDWHDCVLSRHFQHFCIISHLVQGCGVHPVEDWGTRTAWSSPMGKNLKRLDLLCKKSYSLASL